MSIIKEHLAGTKADFASTDLAGNVKIFCRQPFWSAVEVDGIIDDTVT